MSSDPTLPAVAPQSATRDHDPRRGRTPRRGAKPGKPGKPGAPGAKQGTSKVNTSSKGTKIELIAIKVLEAEGYTVHRCVRTGVKRGPHYFSQSNDVFGCIDLVAKKRGERTRWIQVTADGGIGKKKADLAEVPWDPLFDSVEIWRWVGGRQRRHKTTGATLERQYFQVYHHDDEYELRPDRRIRLADGNTELDL
jgi:hypothetical protein